MLLATFFETYGLIIILIAICAAMMIFYFFKHRKQENDIQKFEESLKPGDKIKTYSGFYGEIVAILDIKEDDEDVKVVTLRLGNGSYIDVDIRAIAQIDKRDIKEEEQTLESRVAELRMKEDLAKRDLNKANARPMFSSANLAKKEDEKKDKKEDVKAEVKEEVKKEEPEKSKEPEKFVPKKFEKREFGTSAKIENNEKKTEENAKRAFFTNAKNDGSNNDEE